MRKIYILFIFSILFTQSILANDDKFLLSKIVYDTIEKAQGMLDKHKYKSAKNLLLKVDKSHKVRKKLDKAYIKFYIGYLYTLKENWTKAIPYFKDALQFKALPPEQIKSIRLNLVQIYMQKADYNSAIKYIDQLIGAEPSKAQYYIYKANANLALKKYSDVIKNIDHAIKLSKKKKANWLKTKFYCFYVLKEYPQAIATLKELIAIEPQNKEYWMQLSSLNAMQHNSLDTIAALDVARILQMKLNKSELLQLISLLQYMNIPYKAAEILQSAIEKKIIQPTAKELENLGNLYYEAKEFNKAIKFYLQAAKKSNDSKLYFTVAKIYSNLHNNKGVIKSIKLSLQGKKSAHIGEKKLLLARAYYELGMIKKAKTTFTQALKYPKSKKVAFAWLEYLK